MTWTFVFVLAATAYAFKFLGLVVIGGRTIPPMLAGCLALIPAALISAITVSNTFGSGQHLQLDARALGVGVATLAAWRKAPMIVIILAGAGATALLRAWA